MFDSTASNLIASDTSTDSDCFLHNLDTGLTELVSIGLSGADVSGIHCRVSDDGRFVTFSTQTYSAVYLRDRMLGTTRWLSYGGNLFGENDCWDGFNVNPSISGDGRFVLFQHAMDEIACDLEQGQDFLFIFDRENITWEAQALPSDRLAGGGPIDVGRFFTYRLDPPGNPTTPVRVFLRDRELEQTEEIGLSSAGEQGDDSSFGGRVTSDGSLAAFSSKATNLVSGDTNLSSDAFLRDRVAETTGAGQPHVDRRGG